MSGDLGRRPDGAAEVTPLGGGIEAEPNGGVGAGAFETEEEGVAPAAGADAELDGAGMLGVLARPILERIVESGRP